MVLKKYFISLFLCSLFLISHAQSYGGIIQYIKENLMIKRSVGVHDKRYWNELYKDEKLDKARELAVVAVVKEPSAIESIIKKRDIDQIKSQNLVEDDLGQDRLNEYINNHDDDRLKKWFQDLKKKKGTFDSKEENRLKSVKLQQHT